MYKLGLKLWSINTDYYYDEAVKLYNERVYDYIELYVVPDSTKHLTRWMALEIPYVIHAPHFAHGFNLAKNEKEASNSEIYKEVKEYADSLMTDSIIFHGGIDGSIEETSRQLINFGDPRALIENKPYRALPQMGGGLCRGYSLDEIRYVIDVVGCGFCFDIGHAICSANSQKIEPYAYIEAFMGLNPNMCHLTDIEDLSDEYDKHLHIGEGELDIAKVLSIISENTMVTIETVKNSKVSLDDFVEDVDLIKNI